MKTSRKVLIGVFAAAAIVGGAALDYHLEQARKKADEINARYDFLGTKIPVMEAEAAIAIGTAEITDHKFKVWLEDGEDSKGTGIITEYNFASGEICEGKLEDPASITCTRKLSELPNVALVEIKTLACETAKEQGQKNFIRAHCPG